MQICRELAGFSYGQADIVRRAMSKKKHDVMEQERQRFVYGSTGEDNACVGCVGNGIPEAVANKIFDDMTSFASYAFNKPHAAAYAFVAYRTAYLKCHYFRAYMAALLTSVLGNTDKVIEYTSECQRMGVQVLPPDINKSGLGFTVEGDNLRFGLLALKNVGRNLIETAIARRKEKPFTSLYDFCQRLHGAELNRRAVESFIKAGAFDALEKNRRSMLTGLDAILKSVENESRRNLDGQLSLFGGFEEETEAFRLPKVAEFTPEELLQMEKEMSGLYLSGHPLEGYRAVIEQAATHRISQITGEEGQKLDGRQVTLVVIIVKFRYLTTKNDATMAFLTVEDLSGSMEVVVFPKVLHEAMEVVAENAVVVLRGRVSVKEEEAPKLLADAIISVHAYRPGELGRAADKKQTLFLRLPNMQGELFERVKNLLSIFEGATPVMLYLTDTEQVRRAPRTLWVQPTALLQKELEGLLGKGNVVLK